MKSPIVLVVFAALFVLTAVLSPPSGQLSSAVTETAFQETEAAYRANNIGVALLEQYKAREAVDSFRRALEIKPDLVLARINLAIALYYLPDAEGAKHEAEKALTLKPDAPQPRYILGLIARAQNRFDDARAAFQKVLQVDPDDVGANVNVGQIFAQQRKSAEAIAAFRRATAAEPYNETALYNLGLLLTRSGGRAEGQQLLQKFQQLKQSGAGTSIGNNYLEGGRYAEAIVSTGAEPDLVDRADPTVTFTDATEAILGIAETTNEFSGPVTLFDFDLDGDLDLFRMSHYSQRLYRNDAGKFSQITDQSGALSEKLTIANIGAVAGDYDNDGKPDLFVLRFGRLLLYHNDGGGKFSDVSSAAGFLPHPYVASSAAFVDADHDGDLDIFIANFSEIPKPHPVDPRGIAELRTIDVPGAPNTLLRNDGNGKFSNVTATARLNRIEYSAAVIPTDFNNRRDIDLLIINYDRSVELFSNQRDGTFRNVALESELKGRWTCVAAGDVNKDGYTDFFFGNVNAPGILAISDGREKFKSVAAPSGSLGVSAVRFFDYDNDGLLDCIANTAKGITIWRNLGDSWKDVSKRTLSSNVRNGGLLAIADIDNDGDQDLLFGAGSTQLRIARNNGGNKNHSLRVNLTGKVSNRSGVGAKVEVRAGSLTQKIETYSAHPAPAPADLIFGLGKRKTDVLRVFWPAGIVQAETDFPGSSSTGFKLDITELDRKPSSCPYLYAWNGKRFEFVTDFMGGGEMGYLEAPGHYNKPDADEYVRITADQLTEKDGRYELRVTNELEEALFVDRLQMLAVAHPIGTEIYPNEGMTAARKPFKLFAMQDARPPLSAKDDHGHDVLDLISRIDRRWPDDFKVDRIRGYADEHTLTLNLAEPSKVQSPKSKVLLLTGWTDYAWSSDNVAATQAGKAMNPPSLQVKDRTGAWRTVIEDIGIPVGRPQTVTVDLTGKFRSDNREVRIVTNMRIYWDQILVGESDETAPGQIVKLDPIGADLRWRGFSDEVTPDGREPFGYDYQRVSLISPWKVMTGRYTREGDVRELLLNTDDMFVICRTGDEISLSFDAMRLPPLPGGWKRTFLLYSDGFSKEMDINSASPDQVGPLPFHGMSRYPYKWPERYPLTEARRNYLEKYNTRVVTAPVLSIESLLINR